MALSDYLTNDEWDGMFYVFVGPGNEYGDLGACMHTIIEKLLSKGYEFQGLDGEGHKKEMLGGHNAPKVAYLFSRVFGTPFEKDSVDPGKMLLNGRAFIKEHLPELLTESDESWQEFVDALKQGK